MISGITPRLPLRQTRDEGFVSIKTTPGVIQQNLKNLLLTNPGERLFDKSFGVGMKRFLFDQNVNNTFENVRTKIKQQVGKYMSFLDIKEINIVQVSFSPNMIFIEIQYLITPLRQMDTFRAEIR